MRYVLAVLLFFVAAWTFQVQAASADPTTLPGEAALSVPDREAASAPATAAATAPALAEETLTTGMAPGSRILKTFDFEEKALGNFETLPMFWNKVAGRGYPLYTGGHFDTTVFRSKSTSFKLQLDGGSVAYQLAPGKLPITPNADYYIIGFIKTTALQYARAEIAAWFADANGKVLPATEVHSARVVSAGSNADWTLVHIYIPGTSPEARSLVLQVGLLQPQQLSDRRLGRFEIYRQDIKGAAWFDDISVFQLPRLSISTAAPANIFAPNQLPEFDLAVSDLGRDHLSGALAITDAEGREVHREAWPLTLNPGTRWKTHASTPPLPAGYYTATLDVFAGGAGPAGAGGSLIARRQTHFLTTAALGLSPRPGQEFGFIADAWPVEAWSELPPVLDQTGVGLVKLPAWRKDMSEESLLRKDPPFDLLLAALQRQEVATVCSFADVPSVLTRQIHDGSDSVLGLLDADPNVWRPYVSFILARYAGRIDLWQIGNDRDTFYANDARYGKLFARTRTELAALVAAPRLAIPWNALYDFDAKAYPGAVLDLRLPASIKAAQIPTYIHSLSQHPETDILAIVEPLDEARYPRLDRLADFAQRIVLARSANPRAVLIDLPLTRQTDLSGQTSQPTELLLVYRTLVKELAGAVFRGELPLEPGVRAFLFDHQGIGTLVLWNEDAATPQATLHLALGKEASAVDLWGRALPLPVKESIATVSVGAAPIILQNIDARLAQLRGSFGLGTSVIPAGAGLMETTVCLRNPYDAALSGKLFLQPPAGWTIDPPSIVFSIQPGGVMNKPITLRYPYSEFAGPKLIRARLIRDDDADHALDMTAHVTVASSDVEMECFAHFMPDGQLVLQQMITNTSPAALNAQAYAMVPGLARQQRFVLDLKPAQTIIKRYTFANGAALLGKVAALGIRQNDGTTMLTKAVPLE